MPRELHAKLCHAFLVLNDSTFHLFGVLVYTLEVKFENQGHRSKFKVTGGKLAKVMGVTSCECFLLQVILHYAICRLFTLKILVIIEHVLSCVTVMLISIFSASLTVNIIERMRSSY